MSLYEAARAGNVARLRKLLTAGAGVDTPQQGQENLAGVYHGDGTALMAAAEGDQVAAARLLLEAGADPNARNANGATPLLHAAAPGHSDILSLLLDAGAAVNGAEANGRTPLAIAAWAGHLDAVGLLLRRGADLQAADRDGNTPLHNAVRQRQPEVARALLRAGANIDARDRFGKTPLHLAAEKQFLFGGDVDESRECAVHRRLARMLLDAGANQEARDQAGYTPFIHAAGEERPGVARLLIARGADVNAATANFGQTPLMMACDDPAMTRLLLRAGADPKRTDRDGETAVLVATAEDKPEVVRLLATAGADLNRKAKDGRTPLGVAAEAGNARLFDLLLSLGATDRGGAKSRLMREELLREAAGAGDVRRVGKLLETGVNVNAHKEHEGTALWFAADQGHLRVVEVLLNREARVDVPGQYGAMPLHRAAEGGHADVVRALIDAGADIHATYRRWHEDEHKGWTPLMAACEAGDVDGARALIEAGADVNAWTKQGYTPLLYAAGARSRPLVRLLRSAGAAVDGVAEHFLEAVACAGRLKSPEFRRVAHELATICGVPPRRVKGFRDGVLFDLKRSSLTADRVARLLRAQLERLRAARRQDVDRQTQRAVRDAVQDQACEAAIHTVIDRVQADFLRRGCYALYVPLLSGDVLALLPTADKYAAVACLGPGPRGVPAMIGWLETLDRDHPFVLRGASGATLLLQFTRKITEREALARRLFHLGSDERGVVEDGQVRLTETIRALAEALATRRPIVRLWWD